MLPVGDEGDAIAELDKAFRSDGSVLLNRNPAVGKRVAVREKEAHLPTPPTCVARAP